MAKLAGLFHRLHQYVSTKYYRRLSSDRPTWRNSRLRAEQFYGFAPTSKYSVLGWKCADVVFCSAVRIVVTVALILALSSTANNAFANSGASTVPSNVAKATPLLDIVQSVCLTACQWSATNALDISFAKSAPSGSNNRDTIPIGSGCIFKRASINLVEVSPLSRLGCIWASRARLAALNFSVVSRAVAASAIACAVDRSFSEILRSAKCSLTAAILMAPILPINTAAAPTINTTFDHAKSESAKADETSHINTLWVLGFLLVSG